MLPYTCVVCKECPVVANMPTVFLYVLRSQSQKI